MLPAIAAGPATVEFQAAVIGAPPPSQNSTLTNTGGGTLEWTVDDDAPWLDVGPVSGSLGPQESAALLLTADPTGLGAGTHTATVTVTALGASNSPQTFFVTLDLAGLPPSGDSDSGRSGGARCPSPTPARIIPGTTPPGRSSSRRARTKHGWGLSVKLEGSHTSAPAKPFAVRIRYDLGRLRPR